MSPLASSTLREKSSRGQEQICSAMGPIGRTLEDTIYMTKLLFSMQDRNKDGDHFLRVGMSDFTPFFEFLFLT